MHLPLKQGLRLLSRLTTAPFQVNVRVHLPLKQGLRLKTYDTSRMDSIRTSASSIKTRIKTYVNYSLKNHFLAVRVHLPLKQGLRQEVPN